MLKSTLKKIGIKLSKLPYIGRFFRIAIAVIRLPEFRNSQLELNNHLYQAIATLSNQEQNLKDELTEFVSSEENIIKSAPISSRNLARDVPFLHDQNEKINSSDRKCFIFLTQTYPPDNVRGIGRHVHHLAQEIAGLGHEVHVLTTGHELDSIDFEENVWVHRICIRTSPSPEGLDIPQRLWHYSNTMLEEAEKIQSRRKISWVCAPIWGLEGIAFLDNPKFKLITSLHTTLSLDIDSSPNKVKDSNFIENYAIIQLEKKLILESDGIFANSKAIIKEIERVGSFEINKYKIVPIPNGMPDWTTLDKLPPSPVPDGYLRICFIGRLESRKGIDTFLAIVPELLKEYSNIHIDIIGNDKIPIMDSLTARDIFEIENPSYSSHPRLIFHGEVNDEQLRGFYAATDIVVAPSRFESFGLVHLEAMVFSKVIVGCNIGGMTEVIENGVTGILADPGNSKSLAACIKTLIEDPIIRNQYGNNARASYQNYFTEKDMAKKVSTSFITYVANLATT